MFTRFLTASLLGLGLLLAAAESTFAQGPSHSRGGPPKAGAAHAKGKHHKHHRGGCAKSAKNSSHSRSYARPPASGFNTRSGMSDNFGGPRGFGSMSGGSFGGSMSGRMPGTGGSISGGFGGTLSRGGLPPFSRSTSSSSSEIAQLKRELAELRNSVNKLSESMRSRR